MLIIRLNMPKADYPQTDVHTEVLNRVIGDILRSICAEITDR